MLPGYLLHHDDGTFEPLVHPSDERTGLRYGVLPWIHAISADLLTPEQARHHLDLIEEHLLGPDGARLFDRPVGYVGGPMTVFQRAEASTFWGREIGLMYIHAHLRYAEALARVGDGDAPAHRAAKASPVGLDRWCRRPARVRRAATTRRPTAPSPIATTPRSGTPALLAGDVPLEGGWRVYSSGSGARAPPRHRGAARLPHARRRRRDRPGAAARPAARRDELTARLPLAGPPSRCATSSGPLGHGVRRVSVGGRELDLRPLTNPYRRAGGRRTADLLARRAAPAGTTAPGPPTRPSRSPWRPTDMTDVPGHAERPWLDATLPVEDPHRRSSWPR